MKHDTIRGWWWVSEREAPDGQVTASAHFAERFDPRSPPAFTFTFASETAARIALPLDLTVPEAVHAIAQFAGYAGPKEV